MGQSVVEYINQCRSSGSSDDQIRSLLVEAGYAQPDIDAAFAGANSTSPNPQVIQSSDSAQISNTESSVGEVTNVNSQAFSYVRKKYLLRGILIAAVVLIMEAILAYWFVVTLQTNPAADTKSIIELMFLPIIIGYSFWAVVKARVEDAFMEEFAKSNNFSFQEVAFPAGLDGFIFSLGYNKISRDVVSGLFDKYQLSLFNYSYTVGSGRNAHTFTYTVFRLEYPDKLPPIFLRVRNYFFSLDDHEFGGTFEQRPGVDSEKVQLEGDFNKSFLLYTQRGFETETLEVFSPDFMAKMEDDWKSLCLELVGNHVYIYSYSEITKKADLDNIYSLARYLVDNIGPLAARMKLQDSAVPQNP